MSDKLTLADPAGMARARELIRQAVGLLGMRVDGVDFHRDYDADVVDGWQTVTPNDKVSIIIRGRFRA